VIGENIGYYDEGIVEEIIKDGHELGNHTFNHEHTKNMTQEDFYRDVKACHDLIKEKYNYDMKIFRPPEGYIDEKVKNIARELDYSIIIWSIDTKDWEHVGSDIIVGNVEKNASDGDIILMHDYVSKPNTTIGALEGLIKKLKSEGYSFVTVSELIKSTQDFS
jgi:peptidoglycan/xylan/chitin deacetylase (PgdA/CDA1 family)